MDAIGPLPEDRRKPKRRWAASHRGTLLLIGVVVILIVGSVLVPRLVNRYSPGGKLLAHIPESIRETCRAEYTDEFVSGFHFVAVDGHPMAIAGFFCHWKGGPEGFSLTYLLFDRKAWMVIDYRKLAYGAPKGDDCLIEKIVQYEYSRGGQKSGLVYCNRDYNVFGEDGEPHIIWTDDEALVLTDASACFGCDSQPLYQWWQDLQAGRVR